MVSSMLLYRTTLVSSYVLLICFAILMALGKLSETLTKMISSLVFLNIIDVDEAQSPYDSIFWCHTPSEFIVDPILASRTEHLKESSSITAIVYICNNPLSVVILYLLLSSIYLSILLMFHGKSIIKYTIKYLHVINTNLTAYLLILNLSTIMASNSI